ncbi:unnamed protein product [Ixodes persulcatus]
MRYNRTFRKQSVTELFSTARAPDRSVPPLSDSPSTCSRAALPCSPKTKSSRRQYGEVKPCSVLLSRLSDDGIAELLGASCSKRSFTLRDKRVANGLGSDLKARLALSTESKREGDGPVKSQVKAHCDPPEVKYSKEMSNVREAATLQAVSLVTQQATANAEPDKSEELADIIKFLIETDPKRSKEVHISLAAEEPGINKKTAAIERPKEAQEHFSTPQKLKAANFELVRDCVTDSVKHLTDSKEDVVIQHSSRCRKIPAEVKDVVSSTNGSVNCSSAVEGQPSPSVVSQKHSGGSGILKKSTAEFVLPAPSIYGFTYEPELNAQRVSGLSSPDSVLGACQAPKANSPLPQTEIISEFAAMGVVDSPKETSRSAGDRASDHNRTPLNSSVKDEAAYSSSTCKALDLEASGERPKTMVPDTLRPPGISEETSDSLENSAGARLVIEDKDDACPDIDKAATPSPPFYRDTRSRCEEDDSCNVARRNDESLGGDQLRTAARPDVDTELESTPVASVSHNKAGSSLKCAGSGTGPEERNSLLVPEKDAPEPKQPTIKSESVPEEAARKDSDVESDDTEALEWAPCTVLTPCNSPGNSRESGFKNDREASDAQLLLESVGCQRELSASDSKEDSGIPDGNVMSDDGEGDEVTPTATVEARGKILKPANLISVFTEIQEGKIVSVDCKKFRKRDRPGVSMSSPSKKFASAKEQLNGSANRKAGEDVDAVVSEVLRDLIEKTVKGSSGLLGEKISTENLRHLFRTFCESNGYRYQDFVSDEAGLNLSALFEQPLVEMQDIAMKKRRRGSSDHGSSSDHGPEIPPRITRKRRKCSTPVPEKRMLTRSQWRRTCNVKSFEEAACRDETKNDDEPRDATHGRESAVVSPELFSSNTESSMEVCSAKLSQELGSTLSKCNDSTSPEPQLETSNISTSAISAAQVHSVQSPEPPKLSCMEASVASSPCQLTHPQEKESAKSPERTDMFPDLDVSDQEEDRLVICDSEDIEQLPASPTTCHSDNARALESREQWCGAAKSLSPMDEVTKREAPATVPKELQESAKRELSVVRVLCESEEAAGNTSVICHSAARADSIETTSPGDADGSAAFPRVRTDSTLPATVANVSREDAKHLGASSCPTSAADGEAHGLVLVKDEPATSGPTSHGEGVSGAQGGSEEPLDLSVKESTFRPRADIPVGKVHPQMASAPSPIETNDSPINYSSKSGASESNVVNPRLEAKGPVADANHLSNNGSQSTARSEGSKEDTGSDSILQRLLLDPNRKPKEPETESPMPVILDVRSLYRASDSPKDTGKRSRDSDIVTEAKSLLSARLAAKQQSSSIQLPKGSTVASVPPMSFPENKLGMSTLESKIMELKKQIHHLTILATYKEKELACISSLRTAKEDALKQLEHKYPGICSVVRDFGSDGATSEPSNSPGMTDVPSIVTQAATATSLSAGGPSDSDPPLQKKLAVQPPLIPAPRLRIGIPEHESSRRLPLPYERSHSSTPPGYSQREVKQPAALVVAAPAKSAFCVPSATLQGHRTQRLLLPKAPAPQHPVSTAVSTSPRLNTSALTPSSAAMATWWNGSNGAISSAEQPSSLSHHLRRDNLREYASPSSPEYQKTASLSPAMKTQHQGGAPQRQSSGDTSARPSQRRSRESSLSISEGSREVASAVSRHPEDFGLSMGPSGAVSGQSSTAYALNRANIAATNIYNQAMAYSLYQQLRLNKEASSVAQAEASATSASLLEKMKQGLPPSQQQMYQKSLGSLLEQAKGRPTAWEHLNLLLQKESMDVPAAELPWAQSGLACINCGDPRVKYVCSCCRTQTFCSEQCQIKLWTKQKTQTSTKH